MGKNDYTSIYNKMNELKALIYAKANTSTNEKERRQLTFAGAYLEDQFEYQIEKAQKIAYQQIRG